MKNPGNDHPDLGNGNHRPLLVVFERKDRARGGELERWAEDKGFEWHLKELRVIKEDHSQICS